MITTYNIGENFKIRYKLLNEENQQPLYRYMNKKYINEFFKSGTLHIPSFERCRNHKSNIRQDPFDGYYSEECENDSKGNIKLTDGTFHNSNFKNSDKNHTDFVEVVSRRTRGHVLSTSTELSSKLQNHFKTDGILEITNPIRFGKAILESLYQAKRMIITQVLYENNIDMNDFKNLFEFMIKDAKFSNEKEFRFVFPVDKNDNCSDYIEIKCPKAIQFCNIKNACENKIKQMNVKGKSLLKQNESNSALFYQEITRRGLDDVDSNYEIGLVWMCMGKYEDAMCCFDRALELNPKFASAYTNKAFILCKMKKFDVALKNLNKALTIEPNAKTYYNIAVVLKELGMYYDALIYIRRATNLEPDNVNWHNIRDEFLKEFRCYGLC
ncbi:MAG: tetratricopeptide repeat protein [Candidatus Nitrosoabyssus spongiisocia]|nr:MAG: tetratricopeptide repeat protein [Nitrosopumilaceae archaeon AB1(1)]